MLPNRRMFLRATLSTGASMALLRAASGEPVDNSVDFPIVRRSARAFGTTVSIAAIHSDRPTLEQALKAAMDELHRVESLMSVYDPDSEVSRLNRSGQLRNPHPYVVEVLRQSERYSRLSAGAFDITVQPLWKLYSEAAHANELPSSDEIQAARQLVDWRQVSVRDDLIRLRNQGAKITLNGIAQGYAADRVAACLKSAGIENSLVDAGELCAAGRSATGSAWSAGIQHPRQDDAYCGIAALGDRSLATSGDYETTFGRGYQNNHLFDPRTGRSPTELASVSVAAFTAAAADALSTAICVLGIERGRALIEQVDGADMYVTTKAGRSFATNGFPLLDS